jgi:hypothetical protein
MEQQNTDNIKSLLDDLNNILNDIFLSGLGSVKDNTIEDMKELSKKCNDIGLFFAGEKLDYIANELSKKQHSIGFDYSELVEAYYGLRLYKKVLVGEDLL